jgi:predicted  nucleic acid-binding Zn-ribbon protein
VNFTWKKDGVKALGFIAQDVEKVLPEVVNTDKTTTLKSVQYANIVAVVVEAFKSFYHEVNEHFHQVENRVAKLESVNATEQKQAEEINQLKKENEQMQAKIDALSRSVSSLMQASQLKKASSSKRVPASTESH